MSDLVVKRVSTRGERKQFLEFPWTLYRDDPNWIPPLRSHQKELVGYGPHPFYETNLVQTFLACRGPEVCGRIAAILNRGHIHRHSERRGFFGFFECVDDQQVANGLFDAVRQWFADQGIHSMRGPTNPSMNYELGLLIDGFDSTPFFMMTYNRQYYARLIEGYGFHKAQDMYAYWGHVEMLPEILAKLGPIAKQIVEHYQVRLRSLDRSRFVEDVEEFLSVYNRSMTETWGFVPMSKAEVRHVARALRYLIVPKLTIAAEVDGKMVGASFGMLDYNPRIRQIDGRLFPFGVFRLLRNRRKIKRIRLVSTNVVPEFQRMGIGLVLMHGLVPKAMEWGLEEAEFSWVLESNFLSRGSLEKGGAKITKTYRLYDWENEAAGEGAAAGVWRAALSRPRPAAAHGALEIREVHDRRDLDRFCRVPWLIYAEDPQWVPPLLVEVKEFLNPRKHPFYLHGEATQFLASRGGVAVGRILVSDDPRYNEQCGSNLGCFGMFESIDDREVAHGLLGAAADWLRGRGRRVIRGPIDYSMNYPCGLLIEGFETPPRVMMNHHRPYYAGLLESWGLAKVKDLHSWWFLDPYQMITQWHPRAERLAGRGGVTIRPFRKHDFAADVHRCQAVYNEAWRENWGFTKFSDAEVDYLAKRLARLAKAELVLLAEAEGKPVGFSITLPDINEAIRPLGGRLTNFGLPINFARLAYHTRHIKTARMAVLGLLPQYRRRGITELLILRTLEHGRNIIGYTGAELGWTLEDNYLVNRTLETVGARRYKTYRIYEKRLDG
jgi:GNAT superfamily N-acetyltransferase